MLNDVQSSNIFWHSDLGLERGLQSDMQISYHLCDVFFFVGIHTEVDEYYVTMLYFHEHVKRYRVILREFRNPGFPFETMPIHHIFPKVLVQGVPKKLTAKAAREVGPFQPQHSSLVVMSTCRPNCCHSEWTQKRRCDVGYECG